MKKITAISDSQSVSNVFLAYIVKVRLHRVPRLTNHCLTWTCSAGRHAPWIDFALRKPSMLLNNHIEPMSSSSQNEEQTRWTLTTTVPQSHIPNDRRLIVWVWVCACTSKLNKWGYWVADVSAVSICLSARHRLFVGIAVTLVYSLSLSLSEQCKCGICLCVDTNWRIALGLPWALASGAQPWFVAS